MRRVWVICFSLLGGSAVLAASERAAAVSPVNNFLSRPEQPLHQYRAFRRMHAVCDSGKYEAWLEAWTELKDGRFSYEVVSEKGSDMARSRVLRPILVREQEIVSNGDGARSELTLDNYEFKEAGRDGNDAHVVQLKPRRPDVMLVDGRAVLDDGGDLLRIEGKLAKNPSFWTSLVNIVRRYARIRGVRVPVATETTAKVKFVGTAQLDVVYQYQSVNGQRVAINEPTPTGPSRIAER